MDVCKYESHRKAWGAILQISSTLSLIQALSLACSSPSRPGWPRLCLPLPPQPWAQLFLWALRISPGPHECLVSTFLTNSSPQPPGWSPLSPRVTFVHTTTTWFILIPTQGTLTRFPTLPVHNSLLALAHHHSFLSFYELSFLRFDLWTGSHGVYHPMPAVFLLVSWSLV